MERYYITKAGFDKLANELDRLKNVKRKEIAAMMADARSFGDLTENSEYESAKQEYSLNELRVSELESRLARTEIISESTAIPGDKVYLGAAVKVVDLDSSEEETFHIVSSMETSDNDAAVSTESPVGKALLGHKVGDEVSVQVPRGALKFRIIGISRA